MKNEKIVHLYPPLGTFSEFCYMFIVFLIGLYLRYQVEISAFLSCVEVNKYVKFQIPRYKGFKVGIFRIQSNLFWSISSTSKEQ